MNEIASPAPAPRTAPIAIWSLVLSVLGIIPLGLLASIPAVICGHLALPRIRKSAGALGGHGLAVAGLVIGYIGLALQLLVLPALLLPAVSQARAKAQQAHDMNNLRQIGVACYARAIENGAFPSDLRSLTDQLTNPAMFLTQASKRKPGDLADVDAWSDFVLVPNRTERDPADTVLAFSKPGCYPKGGGIVVTVGGAVFRLDRDEYERRTAGLVP